MADGGPVSPAPSAPSASLGPSGSAGPSDPSPLGGRRILVLRPEAQADDLARALEALGAAPVVVPAIRIEPLQDWTAVDRVLDRIDSYDWVLFTSVNGVASVTGRMADRGTGADVFGSTRDRGESVVRDASGSREYRAGPVVRDVPGAGGRQREAVGRDATGSDGPRVGAIGPATRQALEQAGIAVDWVPSRFTTQALAAELPPAPARSGRLGAGSVCVFRADVAGPELDDALSARGFSLDRVDAYRTIPAASGRIAEALGSGIDVIAFTSASIVRAFAEARAEEEATDSGLPLVCCIGPATARACEAAGFAVDSEATEHTIPGLVRAIADLLERPGE